MLLRIDLSQLASSCQVKLPTGALLNAPYRPLPAQYLLPKRNPGVECTAHTVHRFKLSGLAQFSRYKADKQSRWGNLKVLL